MQAHIVVHPNGVHIRVEQSTVFHRTVLDTHDARHHVDNPLRIDDHVVLQVFRREVLQRAEIVKKLNGLQHFGGFEYARIVRDVFDLFVFEYVFFTFADELFEIEPHFGYLFVHVGQRQGSLDHCFDELVDVIACVRADVEKSGYLRIASFEIVVTKIDA